MASAARDNRVFPLPAVGGEVGDAADRGAVLHRGDLRHARALEPGGGTRIQIILPRVAPLEQAAE